MKILIYCFLFVTIHSFSQSEVKDIPKDTLKIYRTTDVDRKPLLTRGMYTLSLFISKNFNIDESIKNKKIIIFTSFIVEKDGSMSDIKAFHVDVRDYIESNKNKTLSAEEKITQLDQIESMKGEAVRVLKSFDKQWIPAKHKGEYVRCIYNYPINFTIE